MPVPDLPVSPYTGVLFVHLRAAYSTSLKDRRRIVRSLLDRIRNKWDVSATDLGPDNDRNDIFLAFAAVGTSVAMANERLEAVYSFICRQEEYGDFDLLDSRQEVSRFGNVSYGENQ